MPTWPIRSHSHNKYDTIRLKSRDENKKLYLHLACSACFAAQISALTYCTGCFGSGCCSSWSWWKLLLLISSCFRLYNVILGYSIVSDCLTVSLLSSFRDVKLHLRKVEHCGGCCLNVRNHSHLGISWRHCYLIVCLISSSPVSSVGVICWYLEGCSCSSCHWTILGS